MRKNIAVKEKKSLIHIFFYFYFIADLFCHCMHVQCTNVFCGSPISMHNTFIFNLITSHVLPIARRKINDFIAERRTEEDSHNPHISNLLS